MQRIKEKFSIPSDIKHIRKISTRMVNSLLQRNIDKSVIFDVRLSVEEAILNAIEHGNRRDASLAVDVFFEIDDEKIEITIEDKGKGFSHSALPDPTTDENILRAHGRGVYLINKLMDDIRYNEKGNRVKLTKFLR